MGAFIDLSGKVFGSWTVLSYVGRNSYGQSAWTCKCGCGTVRDVVGQTLRNGLTISCGCQKGAAISMARTKHGHARSENAPDTRTYRIWCAMHRRCHPKNTNKETWQNYYGRGIRVCEEWRDFRTFLADMGESPDGMSIDRIDNDGNYEKSNCRWATGHQQAMNRRPKRWWKRPLDA